MKKRLLSMLLVLAMVLSMVPVSVSAADVHTPGTHNAAGKCQKCNKTVTWTAWGDDAAEKTSLPTTGHYYLTDNVDMRSGTRTVASDLCLCLNGYTITGPQKERTLAVAAANKFIALFDCTATNVNGVYTAGRITGGKNTTTNGGTIYVGNNNCKLYFYGGIIDGNQSYAGGGAISIANGSSSTKYGSLFMYGGEIRNNTVKNASNAYENGGGIYVGNYGKCYVTGGKITGNEGRVGGGIFAGTNTTVVVKNATVSGNHATQRAGGVYIASGTLSLQEEAVITGNTAVDKNTPNNVYLLKDYAGVTANNLTGNAKIGVTLDPDRLTAGQMHATTASAGTDSRYFESDDTGYEPKLENNQVLLVKKSVPTHTHNGCNDTFCAEHAAINYLPWGDPAKGEDKKLPTSGSYYLTGDVTVTDQTVLSGDLDLCLNGHTIAADSGKSAKRILASVTGNTLTIADCQAKVDNGVYTAGALTGAVSTPSNGFGGAINIGANDKLYLFDGIITGNRSYVSGGGVQLGGTMYMYGGEISGNVAKDGADAGKAGGGICMGNNAKLYAYGGAIRNNDAKIGGAIYAGSGVTILLQDVEITGNTASDSAAGITLTTGTLTVGGETRIIGNNAAGKAQNVVLLKDVAGISANGLTGNAKIGVTLNTLRIGAGNMNVTADADKDLSNYFESDDLGLVPAYSTQVYLKPAFEHIHCVCGETGCTEHTQIEYLAWKDATKLPTAGSYCLQTDVTVSAQTVLSGDLNLCLHGKTVTGFNGNRIIASNGGHTLTISDCAAKTKDGVYTAGKLTGAIHSADKNNSGGAIFVGNNDTLNLYDGIITGNQAYGGGGAVSVGGVMNMYGGQISGNSALGAGNGREGGAIYVNKTGKAYLYGGTISGNQARVGGGVYCLGTVLELAGTKILNNEATEMAGGVFVADNAAVKLSGDTQILGNTADSKASNLLLPDKVVLALGTMGSDAKVAVNASAFRYISGETADVSAAFQSDAVALSVIYKDGKLFMDAADGHKHCLCLANAQGCDHAAVKWAPWESNDSLPTSGNYYLTSDVTVSGQTPLDGTSLNLCLNGFTVKTTKGRIYYTKGDARLTITDCTGKGVITGADSSAIMTENVEASKPVINVFGGSFTGNTTAALGGAIVAQGGTTVNIYGGVFEKNTSIGKLKLDAAGKPQLDDKGNQLADNAIGGAAIGMYGENTVLNIFGGTFKDNKTTHVECKNADGSVSNKGGYGVIYSKGVVNVKGGTFAGGEALLGGGFFLTGDKAVLTIENATITGNYAKGGGAIVLQSGAIGKLNGGVLTGNSCGTAGGGAIYVSTDATLNMAGGTVSGNASASNGGALYVNTATANLTGGEITGNTAAVNGAGVYVNRATAVFNGTAVKNNVSEKGNGGGIYGAGATLIQIDKSEISGNTALNGAGIYATQNQVTKDTLLFSTVIVNEGAVISGNKAETNCGGLMLVGKESVLTLNGGTITGNSAKNGGGVLAQGASTVNMKGGKITGNKASVGGGGMYISADTTLNMEGGAISNNDSENNGGGMLVQRGYAKFTGGTISGNTATTAAGVYFAGGKADIYNVSITGNTARKNCGGVLLGANVYTKNGVKLTATPVVTMHGGSIERNAAPKANAGGVLVQSKDSLFVMKGGSISNNTCSVGGGGIYAAGDTKIQITGGTISGNEAKQGGAIFCHRSDITVTGGKLCNNTATGAGGAMYINGFSAIPAGKKDDPTIRKGIVTVKNVELYGNKAVTGGAFEVGNFGTLNLENVKVHDNIAENIGGGVYINKVSYGNLKNVKIYNNEAQSGGGGGFAINVGSDVKADGIIVENNRADGIGGGIYNRGRLELTNSEIRANATNGNGGGIGTFKTSSIPLSKEAGLIVTNTLVTDNRAMKGAGFYLHVGCISQLTNVTVEKNVSQEEGSGIYANGQTTLTDVTVTGNNATTGLYALYFEDSLYDGHTYYTGKKVLQGKILVKDNQGGDAYLGEGAAIAIPGAGLAEGTYLPLDLHSGVLTQQVIGVYNYEGENLKYVITAGDRSLTDPETPVKAAQQDAPAEAGDVVLYVVIGVFAAAVIAVAAVVIAKKKKKTPAAGQE